MDTPAGAQASKGSSDEAFVDHGNPSSSRTKEQTTGSQNASDTAVREGIPVKRNSPLARPARLFPPGTVTAVSEAIEYLRKNYSKIIKWERVLANLSHAYMADQLEPALKQIFLLKPHERVEVVRNDANVGIAVRYRPLYPITDAGSLLEYFEARLLDPEAGMVRIALKELMDGWRDGEEVKVVDVLEEMEREGRVLLIRSAGGKITHVSPDSPEWYVVEGISGQVVGVDEELKGLWHGIKVPKVGSGGEVDWGEVRRVLVEVGAKAVGVEKKEVVVKRKKGGRRARKEDVG